MNSLIAGEGSVERARYELDLWIPDYLPSLNLAATSRHWSVHHRERKQVALRIFKEMICLKKPKPKAPLERAQAAFIRSSSREPDHENNGYAFKASLDSLVTLGVLADDSPSVIGVPTYAWVRGSRGIRIIVRELFADEPLDSREKWWE